MAKKEIQKPAGKTKVPEKIKPAVKKEKKEVEDTISIEEILEEVSQIEEEVQEEDGISLIEELQELSLLEKPIPVEDTPDIVPSVEEQEETPAKEEKTFVRIVQKGPSKYRLLYSDGSSEWVRKEDFKY